jgi:hypothetical protein
MKLELDFSELTEFANELINPKLEDTFKRITKDIGKALLKRMKSLTPVDEYDLINGWEGNQFAVKKVANGYEVLIVNKDPKAPWVNDGHMAYNQHGGPYKIHPHGHWSKNKPRGRIQVRSPYQWQQGDQKYYVFGHFFVERGILQLENTDEIEQIIMRELQKWWDSI